MPTSIQTTDVSPRLGQFLPGHRKPLMAMIEITNRCNLSCPMCFSNATHCEQDLSVAKIVTHLKQLLDITASPIPIQISGGEPTLHPELPAIVSAAKHLGFHHIELVTNGIRIGENPAMLFELKQKGLTAVYLQFDGLKKSTYLSIRGADLTNVRHRAIEAIHRAKLCCTLAVAVVRNVNEDEIGDVVQFGIDHIDVVRAINFQAATAFNGRFKLKQPYNGFSTEEIVQLIATQSGIPPETFLSEVIGHPQCNAMSLVFVAGGRLLPLFKYIRSDDLQNFLGKDQRRKLLDAFAGKEAFFLRHLTDPKAWSLLAKAAPIFGKNPNNVLRSRHILLFAKGFMNSDALDERRLNDCCYAISGEKGVFSFCAYNNIHRFK